MEVDRPELRIEFLVHIEIPPPTFIATTAPVWGYRKQPLTLSPLLPSFLSPGEREEGEGSWGEGFFSPTKHLMLVIAGTVKSRCQMR